MPLLEFAQRTFSLIAESSIDDADVVAFSPQGSLDRADFIAQTSQRRAIYLSANRESLGFLKRAQCMLRLRTDFSVDLPNVKPFPLQGPLNFLDSISTDFESGGMSTLTRRCSHERLRRRRHGQAHGECCNR